MENDNGNDQGGEMMKNAGAQQGKDNSYKPRVFPPGYVFSPSDSELVLHYLTKKVDDMNLPRPPIREVNIYEYNPMELPAKFKSIGETKWYFFTPRQKRYLNGDRPNRDAKEGYWKPSSSQEPVRDERDNIVGRKRKLVFHQGLDRSDKSKSQKTDWHMQEYTLDKDSTSNQTTGTSDNIMRLDDCVLVKIYKKRRKTEDGVNNQIAAEEIGQQSHDQDQDHMHPPPIPGLGEGQLPSLSFIQEMEPLPRLQFQGSELPPFPSAIQTTIPLSGQHFLGHELPPLPEVQFFDDMGLYGAPFCALSNHLAPNTLDNQMVALLGRPPAFGLNDHAIAPPDQLCDGYCFVNNDSQLQQIGGASIDASYNLVSNSQHNQMVPVPCPQPARLLNDQATAAPDQLSAPIYALSNYILPHLLDNQMVPLLPAFGLNDHATAVPPDQFGDGRSFVIDYSQFQQIGGADGSKQIGGALTNALYNLSSYLPDNQNFPLPALPPALELDDQATAVPDQLGDGVSSVIENYNCVNFDSPEEVKLNNNPVSHEDGNQLQRIGGAEPAPNNQTVSGDWQLGDDWDITNAPAFDFDISDLLYYK